MPNNAFGNILEEPGRRRWRTSFNQHLGEHKLSMCSPDQSHIYCITSEFGAEPIPDDPQRRASLGTLGEVPKWIRALQLRQDIWGAYPTVHQHRVRDSFSIAPVHNKLVLRAFR